MTLLRSLPPRLKLGRMIGEGIGAEIRWKSRAGTLCAEEESTLETTFGGISLQPRGKKQWRSHCSFNSSSDGNGNIAGNFIANDEKYVNSTVIEAVQVRSGSDGFMIKMRSGKCLRCIHNNPQEGKLSDYAPHPAIVLKMEDGSELLLPIIVLEMPCVLLNSECSNSKIVYFSRPTIYQVAKMMVEELGSKVQVVRVTKRVNKAYLAQLYISKICSFDLRPSDAINLAVQCKVVSDFKIA
ncbi:bifunctional nuclease 1-like [Zingiber officinale]|uniref:bifunctional nuclease 1-like n=1 Tax=Zingiber officinale TaxID=94328 RepID=UPI001C4C3D22|nr:bifunctional nuclease 1-like [Zingiber officinale]